MPKQVHYWPNGAAFDAWDVDRLIRLAEGSPVEEVPLDAVPELDEDYWFSPDHAPTVRNVVGHLRRVLEVDPSFPILLGPDGRVMDGMHRIARALLDGRATVPAVRFTTIPAPDRTGVRLGEPLSGAAAGTPPPPPPPR